jgi:hypothetical protein
LFEEGGDLFEIFVTCDEFYLLGNIFSCFLTHLKVEFIANILNDFSFIFTLINLLSSIEMKLLTHPLELSASKPNNILQVSNLQSKQIYKAAAKNSTCKHILVLMM